MKKIIVMAMVGLVAAYGMSNTCAPEDVPAKDTTLVYSVKMTVHTPEGTSAFYNGTPGSVCNPGDGTDPYTTTVRKTDKTHIEGWIFDCVGTCETVGNGSVILWDRDRKVQISDATLAAELLHVIGKSKKEAELLATVEGTANYDAVRSATYALTLGAFGKFSPKNGYYTSFAGSVVGSVTAVYDLKAKHESACEPAGYFLCNDLNELSVDENAVAYGTFSIKLNKAASKKFAKNGYLSLPSYVTVEQN